MISLYRTNFQDTRFITLVEKLDAELTIIDGEDHVFYDQYNGIDGLQHVVVALAREKPVGCGAIKEFSPGIMEIKRMYTTPEFRGKGVASRVLRELEVWAKELDQQKCILETGKRQSDAVALYRNRGYLMRENFGPYIGVDNSVCFEKTLTFPE